MVTVSIEHIPTCTYEMTDLGFMCTHDNVKLEYFSHEFLGPAGVFDATDKGYICVDCDEQVEIEDFDIEAEAEDRLMEILGK